MKVVFSSKSILQRACLFFANRQATVRVLDEPCSVAMNDIQSGVVLSVQEDRGPFWLLAVRQHQHSSAPPSMPPAGANGATPGFVSAASLLKEAGADADADDADIDDIDGRTAPPTDDQAAPTRAVSGEGCGSGMATALSSCSTSNTGSGGGGGDGGNSSSGGSGGPGSAIGAGVDGGTTATKGWGFLDGRGGGGGGRDGGGGGGTKVWGFLGGRGGGGGGGGGGGACGTPTSSSHQSRRCKLLRNVVLPVGWTVTRRSMLVRQFGSAEWPADGRVAAFDFDNTLVVSRHRWVGASV